MSAAESRVKFAPAGSLRADVEREVATYLAAHDLTGRDDPRMYVKTLVHVVWLAASYVGLVVLAHHACSAILFAVSLGLAMAGVGFNVMHDGNHGAYSRRRWVNVLAAASLDLLGGSSHFWTWKHNVIHHTYPNIDGLDDDIHVGWLARLAPGQPRHRLHRFQHLYMWPLYGFLSLKWQLWDDYRTFAGGRILGHPVPRGGAAARAKMFAGKLTFYFLAFGLPLWLGHRLWVVVLVYLAVSFTLGVTLSVVFQLAHCVGEAHFPISNEHGRMEHDWATHQVETTVDFAPNNRVAGWFLGGLNFQIEHHLLPRVCHVHYRAIAPIVESVCRRHGVRYRTHRTLRAALASHFRWLQQMGRPAVA